MNDWYRRIFGRRRMTDDLAEEMQQHLEEKAEAFMAEGMSREEAMHAARRAFGNTTLLEQRSREVWMWPWVESLGRDVRFALRQLRRAPVFTVTAVVVLALGIGANAAIFAVIDAVLLRPLPYSTPGRLVLMDELDSKHQPTFGVAYPDAIEWMKASKVLEGLGLWTWQHEYMKGPASIEHLAVVAGSESLFSVLGVRPELGRGFTHAEEIPGHEKVVLLSDDVWRRQFHGDPNVLGKTVRLDDDPYFVIGVMPEGFSFPFSQVQGQVWVPLA